MREYKSSNKVPFSGFLLMLGAAILAGLVLGGVSALASRFNFYAVCIAPMMFGGVGAAVLVMSVKKGKVRDKFFAGVLGVLVAVIIISIDHFGDYYFTFRDSMHYQYTAYHSNAPQDEVDEFTDLFLEAETGTRGFFGYLKFTAEQGISFIEAGSVVDRNLEPSLQGFWVWVYWSVEFLIISGMCVIATTFIVNDVFDEDGNSWYEKGKWLGTLRSGNYQTFIETLKTGDFKRAGQMMTKEMLPFPRVDIMVSDSKSPEGSALLAVESVQYFGSNLNSKTQIYGLLSIYELDVLRHSVPNVIAPDSPEVSTADV